MYCYVSVLAVKRDEVHGGLEIRDLSRKLPFFLSSIVQLAPCLNLPKLWTACAEGANLFHRVSLISLLNGVAGNFLGDFFFFLYLAQTLGARLLQPEERFELREFREDISEHGECFLKSSHINSLEALLLSTGRSSYLRGRNQCVVARRGTPKPLFRRI